MRIVSNLVEIVGIGLISYGFFLISPAIGVIVLGLFLVIASQVINQ